MTLKGTLKGPTLFSATDALREYGHMHGTKRAYYAAEQLPAVVKHIAKLERQLEQARQLGQRDRVLKLGRMVTEYQFKAQYLAAQLTNG